MFQRRRGREGWDLFGGHGLLGIVMFYICCYHLRDVACARCIFLRLPFEVTYLYNHPLIKSLTKVRALLNR